MTQVKILETNILHASDVIYWLDGTTAETEAEMLRVSFPLLVSFTTRPPDLQQLNTAGKTALWRRPVGEMIQGEASESDLVFPTTPLYPLAGTVTDPDGRYNPRTFSMNAGNATTHGLVVYPTPLGTRFGRSGGLLGNLRFNGMSNPVPWAILTLQVTPTGGAPLTFRAQANPKGDFMLPMNKVPPLAEGVTDYPAQLTVIASSTASPDSPINPANLEAMDLGDLTTPATFASTISFTVVPGEIRLIRSLNMDHLTVQPSSP